MSRQSLRLCIRHLGLGGLGQRAKSTAPLPSPRIPEPDWATLTRPLGQPSPATHPHLMAPHHATPGISREEYWSRRQLVVDVVMRQLAEAKVTPGPILFLLKAPSVTYSAPDVPNPFRQCSDFLYLSGYREPGAILAIYTTDGDLHTARSRLFVGPRDAHKELWEGARAGPEGAAALTGVEEAEGLEAFPAFVAGLCSPRARPRLLYADEAQFPASSPLLAKPLGNRTAVHTHITPSSITHQLRWTKSAAEVSPPLSSTSI